MLIFTDDDNTFTGLYFQDHLMKSSFASYPEIIFSLPVDARKYIHLLGNGRYVLYVWGLIICVTFEHMDKTR